MTYHLFNGDCFEVIISGEVKELLKDRYPIIVTDPPFNIGYKYNEYRDNKEETEYIEDLCELFKKYPFVVIHYPEMIYKISYQVGRFPERVVTWVYNSNLPHQHRDIAYFNIVPDFSLIKGAYKNPTDKRVQELIKEGRAPSIYDWWKVEQVKNVSYEKTQHPCQMPLEVMKNTIGIIPKRDDLIIIDPFMGSGTTGIACRNAGVDFIGIELDKKYFDIATERMKNEYAQETLL